MKKHRDIYVIYSWIGDNDLGEVEIAFETQKQAKQYCSNHHEKYYSIEKCKYLGGKNEKRILD